MKKDIDVPSLVADDLLPDSARMQGELDES